MSIPVGLQVGRETDHTGLLEATGEGILFVVSLALILPEAYSVDPGRPPSLKKTRVAKGIRTYPSAGAQTVRVRHDGGVVVGAGG